MHPTHSKQDRLVQAATHEIALAVTREQEAKKLLTALAKNCGPLRFPATAAGQPPPGSGFRLDADEATQEWVLVYVSPEEAAEARKAEGERRKTEETERPRVVLPGAPKLRIVAS